jgi:hypothetical protein
MTDNQNYKNIEDTVGGDVPFEAFQERSPADVADQVRFLYREYQARVAVRDHGVASLLQQECEIGTRLGEVVRAYGWFNDVGEKERVQLNQELRNVEKERRRLYESTSGDLLKIKIDLMDALLEYRSLRRRKEAFASLLGEPSSPPLALASQNGAYNFPLLPQYLMPLGKEAETPDTRRTTATPAYRSSKRVL